MVLLVVLGLLGCTPQDGVDVVDRPLAEAVPVLPELEAPDLEPQYHFDLVVTPARTDASWWADEAIELDLALTGVREQLVTVQILRADGRGWTGEDWGEPADLKPDRVLAVSSWASQPGISTLTIVAHSQGEELGRTEVEVVQLARQFAWGDLHAHSNLSHDGCESPDDDCHDRGELPAGDFFDEARVAGLDFAAITDHAEWRSYLRGSAGKVDIWQAQNDRVIEAEGTGILPFVGYEWTSSTKHLDEFDQRWGGHRTVVFEQSDVCHDWRIGWSGSEDKDFTKASGGYFGEPNPIWAPEVPDLYEAFEAAAESCGDQRVLVFVHHPAWDPPQPVDWGHSHSVPDERYEPVLEIYSEHGSSECIDPDAENCSWRPKPDSDYYADGSAQAALLEGFRLGFVASTDSHDSRPGTTDDSSCTAILDDDGEIRCHSHGGGVAGVMVAGELSREAVFDGVFDRHTYATSGPRLPVRAMLRTDDGIALPGDAVSAEAGGDIVVSLEGLLDVDDNPIEGIDLIAASGAVLATTDSQVLSVPVSAAPGEAWYVRVRFGAGPRGNGERMWLSPWFFE